MRKPFWIALLIAGSLLSYSFVPGSYFEVTKNLEIFYNIVSELNKSYVDDFDSEKLIRKGIDGMLTSLDPYTSFYPEEELGGYLLQTTGKYGGIGALIRTSGDYVIIAEPYENFPAHRSGLIAGDKILKINGKSAKGLNTEEVSKLLKGNPGTEVSLEIERFGEAKPLLKKLIREEVTIKSVPFAEFVDDGIAMVNLTSFTNECSTELKRALSDLEEQQPLKGIILDLRGNPGGLLHEAVAVANLFLDKGKNIVNTRGKKRDWDKNFKTKDKPYSTDLPLVVLTSRGSASASEIVSGVIQDYDRGLVIGETTFGKGLVQSTRDLAYNAKLKMTTAKYFLPSGRCIQAIDYSGKYNDGVEKISDSLRTVYKTELGRKVYDAGGVDPDVVVEYETFAQITSSLLAKNHIFDFATDYFTKHESIAPAGEFQLSDQDFNDFVAFLDGKDYDYITESEHLLKELKNSAEKENYLGSLEADIEALEQMINHDKEGDLQKFKEEIMEVLQDEIVSRYYFQSGRMKNAIGTDEFVSKAVELLSDKASFDQYLKAN